jgi:mannose-6-phosphate isomerase
MSVSAARPYRVGPNKVPVYYAGGERIDHFRGEAQAGGPEDWVASVTPFPAHLLPDGADPEIGISRLPGGQSLRAVVAEDPLGWLGPQLVESFADEPGLLVKLLDAGERLPVHCHPTRAVAQARLGSRFGKTEGWILLEAAPDAGMWLGFNRPVTPAELRRWVEEQDVPAMLAAMNRLAVRPGDVLYVPAGLPHAFGPGVLLIELQEPTSFSILAEYRVFGLAEDQATLGLGWDVALACFDRTACDDARLGTLRPRPHPVAQEPGGRIERLFGPEAAPYFQAYRLEVTGALRIDRLAGYAIPVVTGGAGTMRWAGGEEVLAAGQTWVVPHGAGPLELEGNLEVIWCAPPDPAIEIPDQAVEDGATGASRKG